MKILYQSKIVVISLLSLWLVACQSDKKEETKKAIKVAVNSAGKLMDIMHHGKVEAQLSLDSLEKRALYGIGALAGLKGEITVINGQSYVATVDSLGARINLNDNAQAALFVYAHVPAWDTLSIMGTADVSSLIEEELNKRSQSGPVPFLMLSQPKQLNYHIINFTGEKPNKSNHKQGALGGGLADQAVQIIGFYSADSKGVYTHHGRKLHMHFLAESNQLTAHVDSLNITDRPVKLLLPRI